MARTLCGLILIALALGAAAQADEAPTPSRQVAPVATRTTTRSALWQP